MTMNVTDFLTILLYIFGCILLVSLTVLTIRLLGTLKKVDELLDDVSTKSEKLDGVFNIVDKSSGVINTITENVSGGISNAINHIIRKKKGNEEDE